MTNDDIVGPGTREIMLKRFMFRYQGKLYVYTSSIPEQDPEITEQEEINEDAEKLVIIF